MDIIESARMLAKELQKDERYIAFQKAREVNDNDKQLQELIGEFNLLRVNLNNEISKDDSDSSKVDEMNTKLRELYETIMTNASMADYELAKGELEDVVNFISRIITCAANGEDPDTVEPEEECGGDCSGCSGCH